MRGKKKIFPQVRIRFYHAWPPGRQIGTVSGRKGVGWTEHKLLVEEKVQHVWQAKDPKDRSHSLPVSPLQWSPKEKLKTSLVKLSYPLGRPFHNSKNKII